MQTFLHLYTYMCTCTPTCMHAYMHAYMRTFIHTCTRTCTHICACAVCREFLYVQIIPNWNIFSLEFAPVYIGRHRDNPPDLCVSGHKSKSVLVSLRNVSAVSALISAMNSVSTDNPASFSFWDRPLWSAPHPQPHWCTSVSFMVQAWVNQVGDRCALLLVGIYRSRSLVLDFPRGTIWTICAVSFCSVQ